jgi:hypothetical protein
MVTLLDNRGQLVGRLIVRLQEATLEQNLENDIIESLNHVVCKIKSVLGRVPETSEVRFGYHVAR